MVNSREMMGAVDNTVFNCPASHAASARTANGVLAWRARFYGGGSTGHGAELPFVFGSKAGGLSEYMMTTWAGFAKDPKNYLLKPEWPTYKPGGRIVRLGYQTEVKASTEAASVVDSSCRIT
jgi:carboxylesterase type B